MKKVPWIRWFQWAGVLLFLYILTRLDFGRIGHQLVSFRLEWLIVYCVSFFGMIYFRALRWQIALGAQQIHFPLRKTLAITAVASFLSIVTPGRLGDFSRVAYLQSDNQTISKSLVSVVLDRLYDVILLIFLGVIGLVYFTKLSITDLSGGLLILAVFLALLLAPSSIRMKLSTVGQRLVKALLPHGIHIRILTEWNTFREELKRVVLPTAPLMALSSLFVYACYFTQIYAVASGFGLSVSYVYLALCLSISALVAMLPISIGGLGTREAVFIGLLSRISVSAETAALVSFFDGTVFALLFNGVLVLGLSGVAKSYKDGIN